MRYGIIQSWSGEFVVTCEFSCDFPIITSIPAITTEKLNSKNYLSWLAFVCMWFCGHGVSDHMTLKLLDIVEFDRIVWDCLDARLYCCGS